MEHLGTIVFDERVLLIENITLGEGKIFFYGRGDGPVKYRKGDYDIRVHAPDGTLVVVAHVPVKAFKVSLGGDYLIEFPLEIENVIGWPRPIEVAPSSGE